jgi:eukaryotic-like serine/threonine-protein kinase
MGEVWKAEHTGLGTPVAVKVIVDAGFGADNPRRADLVRRFFREAQAAASLRSPHVVQIFDHGVDGVPYIAMELLEGETLEERLERDHALSRQMTADVITQIARAVGKAHDAGIVHRDLKPGNVFIVRDDDQEIVKVLDFGIAKVTETAEIEQKDGVTTQTGSVIGTPCYMSPEQALGNKAIDFRSDLWALAIIAFECLVGRRPFDGDALGVLIVQICARPMPVPSAMAPVPQGFDEWFAKAASRDLEGRFQSAKALADALREVLAGDHVRMTHPSMVGLTPPAEASTQLTHPGVVSAITEPSRKRKESALLFGVAGLVAIAAVGLFFALRGSGSITPSPEAITSGTEAGHLGAPGASLQATTSEVAPTPSVTAAPSASPSAETAAPSAAPSASARPWGTKPGGRPPFVKPSGSKPGGNKPDRLGF